MLFRSDQAQQSNLDQILGWLEAAAAVVDRQGANQAPVAFHQPVAAFQGGERVALLAPQCGSGPPWLG